MRCNLKNRKDIPPRDVPGFNHRAARHNVVREQAIALLVIAQYLLSLLWVGFTEDMGALLSAVVPAMDRGLFFGVVFLPPLLTVGISFYARRFLYESPRLFVIHRLNLILLMFGAAWTAILAGTPFVFETVLLLSSLLIVITPMFSLGLYLCALLFFFLGSAWTGGWTGFSWFDIGDVVLTALVGLIMVRFRFSDRVGGYLTSRTMEEQHRQLKETNRELLEANGRLQTITYLDGLTGVSNRRAFDEALEGEWRRAMRGEAPLGLLMVDIDFFKAYNDTYGHQAGDDCLKQVAGALGAVARRQGEVVARYGGEEFAVICPGGNTDALAVVGESLRRRVGALRITHPSLPWGHVSISVGGAVVVPRPGDSRERLIGRADEALYAAKEAGRNRVVIRKQAQVTL
ncbi:GGDEF domain-containing protein [Desulfoluna spongiiphila]|uniref:diguanylate cyclase n=1 Tax=Desulfoluna spongiiphila TaxID=419481 RepID=A0A1G5G9L6_9BACT|nr:GGDEF domain-containing protein [Desulfoluna spongiiphila]SCY48047.1 diguanylate cyclase (GGDEF) domain-containing protein [Desulfoluna spongiiphila]